MTAKGAAQSGRAAIVVLLSLLLAAQVARTAAVADRNRYPGLAGALWPSHPGVLTDKMLLEVATAAAHGKAVPQTVGADLRQIAMRAPLSPDPFLVEAAIAQTRGKGAQAERLLLSARNRDPRSRGTRYLLADRFLRTGRVADGLNEIKVLVGLNDRGAEAFTPMLVSYALTPGSAENLKPLFRRNPRIEAGVLAQLSLDPVNADLVLGLADPEMKNPPWLGTMASALVTAERYSEAAALWSKFSGARARGSLFNPRFAASKAPPPFNWSFPKTPEGVAEADGTGGLEVLYYGRSNAVLTGQLMMLPPGPYRLSHKVSDVSGNAASLHWTIRCAKPALPLAKIDLGSGPTDAGFDVPAGCEAVWLELRGAASESPQTTGLTISGLRLSGGAE